MIPVLCRFCEQMELGWSCPLLGVEKSTPSRGTVSPTSRSPLVTNSARYYRIISVSAKIKTTLHFVVKSLTHAVVTNTQREDIKQLRVLRQTATSFRKHADFRI